MKTRVLFVAGLLLLATILSACAIIVPERAVGNLNLRETNVFKHVVPEQTQTWSELDLETVSNGSDEVVVNGITLIEGECYRSPGGDQFFVMVGKDSFRFVPGCPN